MKTICVKCDQPFRYVMKKKRRRTVCNRCQRAVIHQSNSKRKRAAAALVGDSKAHRQAVALCTQEEVGRALGLTQESVFDGERSALAKLRQHPELLELLLKVREEGIPCQEDTPNQLLDYQLALQEWWRVHDELLTHELTAEALECRDLIEKFQTRLSEFLKL